MVTDELPDISKYAPRHLHNFSFIPTFDTEFKQLNLLNLNRLVPEDNIKKHDWTQLNSKLETNPNNPKLSESKISVKYL